jgi:hypothetical protein
MSAKRKKRRDRKLLRQHGNEPKRIWASPGELQEVEEANPLAYSRKQAAEALGVSISTIDRRLVPFVHTVKTPWGQRLIPVAELERFLREHLEPPASRLNAARQAGRRRYPGQSLSASASSTRAVTASPKSRAHSTTKMSRPDTAADSGGHRRSEPFSSAPARTPPPRSASEPRNRWTGGEVVNRRGSRSAQALSCQRSSAAASGYIEPAKSGGVRGHRRLSRLESEGRGSRRRRRRPG